MKGQIACAGRLRLRFEQLVAPFVNFGRRLEQVILLFDFEVMALFQILVPLSHVPVKVIAVSLPLLLAHVVDQTLIVSYLSKILDAQIFHVV